MLTRDSFSAFPNLLSLELAGNRIRRIEWDSFRLFRLKHISLKENGITTLSENIFRLTPSLEEIDLSGNKLWRVQTSDFSSAQRLKVLNFSQNSIRQFDFDSFAPFYQLETLDLSYNKFYTLPSRELMPLLGLRTLILKGNPVVALKANQLVLPAPSTSPHPPLRVLTAHSLSSLPSIHTIILANNPNLTIISPKALENSSLVFSLDISNCSLKSISMNLLQSVAQAQISGNPLDCGCEGSSLDRISTTIVDYPDVECLDRKGELYKLSSVASPLFSLSDPCPPEVILPFDENLYASVGSTFSIYCAPKKETDHLEWTFPNGSVVGGEENTNHVDFEGVDFFSSTLYSPNKQKPIRPRVSVTKESLRLDVVLPVDAGVYECSVFRGKQRATKRVKMIVRTPKIELFLHEIGAHYASVSWNDSLRIDAADRVALHLTVTDETGARQRAVQLSLLSPWLSYSILRLRPNHNYTFCLKYSLVERQPTFGSSILSSDVEAASPLLESCLLVRTLPSLPFWEQLSTSTLVLFLAIASALLGLFCFHTLFARLHVWQQAKHRSRLNQSISGQSFLSHSSSAHSAHPHTYENGVPNSSSSHCHLSSFPSNRLTNRPTTLRIVQQDIAL
ncbi:unnamed protein product, partial [Mesorhabditis belari]|uniref:Ig-like domain-containing protein n=1 Tax=Mesorhabditis belari TaxID=2138241 RepID=A0AAF3FLF8_9BILA